MATTPVITQPPSGSTGLGNNPRLFGKADPNYSIKIVVTNYGTTLGKGVADANGDWSVDLALDTDQWVQVQAQSYISPENPSSFSGYSAPISIQK
jgi:hypothetical protein